jgi:NitT/TauT family transport system substrate-binding protein
VRYNSDFVLNPGPILLLLIIFSLIGCREGDGGTGNSPGRPLTLQLNWKPEPQFGGFYAADVLDLYKKHGLNVIVVPGGASAPTIDMLGAGTVPFAIVSGDEIPRARANGNNVVALFAAYQTNPQGIMTRASRGFTDISDIFKHPGTLAMERGLPYSAFLERKYGFNHLTLRPSPFGDLTLYRTDENYAMQCFVTSEPLAAKKIGIEPRTFLIAEAGYNPYTTVLATSESFLNQNPDLVKRMVRAAREGWEAYLADPTQANQHMQKLNPTMDSETFAASAEAQRPLIATDETAQRGLGTMTAQRWQTLIEQLVDLAVIPQAIPAEQLFQNPS